MDSFKHRCYHLYACMCFWKEGLSCLVVVIGKGLSFLPFGIAFLDLAVFD